jgi:hypothetical protein
MSNCGESDGCSRAARARQWSSPTLGNPGGCHIGHRLIPFRRGALGIMAHKRRPSDKRATLGVPPVVFVWCGETGSGRVPGRYLIAVFALVSPLARGLTQCSIVWGRGNEGETGSPVFSLARKPSALSTASKPAATLGVRVKAGATRCADACADLTALLVVRREPQQVAFRLRTRSHHMAMAGRASSSGLPLPPLSSCF